MQLGIIFVMSITSFVENFVLITFRYNDNFINKQKYKIIMDSNEEEK